MYRLVKGTRRKGYKILSGMGDLEAILSLRPERVLSRFLWVKPMYRGIFQAVFGRGMKW